MVNDRNKTITIEDGDRAIYNTYLSPEEYNGQKNVTINGDVLSALKLIPHKSVDLAIIDPPYNLNKKFLNNTFTKQSDDDHYKYVKAWFDLVILTLKDTASVYICCDWNNSHIIRSVLAEKMIMRNRITWGREKGRGSKTNWKNNSEDIWYASLSDDYTFNVDDVMHKRNVLAPYKKDGIAKDWVSKDGDNYRLTHPSNFMSDITVPFWSMSENTPHPTQKPEKLIAKLILASSNKGDTILDAFVGSGTTSVVAKKLNREYIGIEIDTDLCILTEKRLSLAEKDDTIQGYKDGVFLLKE